MRASGAGPGTLSSLHPSRLGIIDAAFEEVHVPPPPPPSPVVPTQESAAETPAAPERKRRAVTPSGWRLKEARSPSFMRVVALKTRLQRSAEYVWEAYEEVGNWWQFVNEASGPSYACPVSEWNVPRRRRLNKVG